MADFKFMKVNERIQNLREVMKGFCLIFYFFIHDVIKVLSSTGIFHHNVNHFRSFDNFIHLSDCRMADNFKKMKFARDSFDIRNVFYFRLL